MWNFLNGLWRPAGHGGVYTINRGKPNERRVKNTVVKDGAELFVRSLFRGEAVMPATFYMGLTNANYSYSSALLSDIAVGEPTGNGYARQPLGRNTTDWAFATVGNFTKAESIDVTFTASAQWDKAWTRMFLCNVASGTAGIVFSLSKAIDPQTVLSGEGPTLNYEHWIRP